MNNPTSIHLFVPSRHSCDESIPTPTPSLLLWAETRSTNITSLQLDTKNPLHASQNLLIWRRSTPLEISHDTLSCIALGRQILLRHLGFHLLPLLRDDGSDFFFDRSRLHDIIASIDLGEMLAFDTGFGGLWGVSGWLSRDVDGDGEGRKRDTLS